MNQKCRGSEKYLILFFWREKHAVVGYSILCVSHRNQYSYLYQYTCCLLWWIPGFFAINVRLYPGADCGRGLVSACLRQGGAHDSLRISGSEIRWQYEKNRYHYIYYHPSARRWCASLCNSHSS